jgi:hypothetical protein
MVMCGLRVGECLALFFVLPACVWFTLKTFVHVNESNDVCADGCACGWKWNIADLVHVMRLSPI